jgi:hypothetical protein
MGSWWSGLDAGSRLVGCALNPQHRSAATIQPDHLLGVAHEIAAPALALVVFQSGEPRVPPVYEAHAFEELAARCLLLGLVVVDCIVMRGHHWWSLRERAEHRLGTPR